MKYKIKLKTMTKFRLLAGCIFILATGGKLEAILSERGKDMYMDLAINFLLAFIGIIYVFYVVVSLTERDAAIKVTEDSPQQSIKP